MVGRSGGEGFDAGEGVGGEGSNVSTGGSGARPSKPAQAATAARGQVAGNTNRSNVGLSTASV